MLKKKWLHWQRESFESTFRVCSDIEFSMYLFSGKLLETGNGMENSGDELSAV